MLSKLPLLILLFAVTLQACTGHKKIYTSECAAGITYKQVSFSNLIDSIKFYDKQYVEVSGRYSEGKELSALLNDSLFTDHGNSRALWVNFSQDCPLYMIGTHTGFFEADNGTFNAINKRQVTIRGRVDCRQKGYKRSYAAAIDMISYIAIK